MNVDRALRLLSYALASAVLLVVAAIAGLLDVVPLAGALVGLVTLPFEAWLPAPTPFVGLPLALALVVLVRAAITRSATDGVLAGIAVPCLLVAVWALYSYYFTNPGVYWGSLFTIAVGTLVAIAVLADAAITARLSRNRA